MDNSANAFSDNYSDFLADKTPASALDKKSSSPVKQDFDLPKDSDASKSLTPADPFQENTFAPPALAPLRSLEPKDKPDASIFEPLDSAKTNGEKKGAPKAERFDYLAFGLGQSSQNEVSKDKSDGSDGSYEDDFDFGLDTG